MFISTDIASITGLLIITLNHAQRKREAWKIFMIHGTKGIGPILYEAYTNLYVRHTLWPTHDMMKTFQAFYRPQFYAHLTLEEEGEGL